MNEPREGLLGPSLWIFGTLLWAYVVLGELVVNVGFDEGLAIPLLFGVLVASWYFAARPAIEDKRTKSAVLPGLVGVGLFVLCLLATSVVLGSSRRSHFEIVTVLLCAVGVVAFAVGRRLTRHPVQHRRAGEGLARVAPWLAWIVTGLTTMLAMASAMAHA